MQSREVALAPANPIGTEKDSVATIRISIGAEIGAEDVVGLDVRHVSGGCFGCTRDYWKVANVTLEGEGGMPILST